MPDNTCCLRGSFLKFSVTLVVSEILYQMIITLNISEPLNFYIKTEKLENNLLISVGDVI